MTPKQRKLRQSSLGRIPPPRAPVKIRWIASYYKDAAGEAPARDAMRAVGFPKNVRLALEAASRPCVTRPRHRSRRLARLVCDVQGCGRSPDLVFPRLCPGWGSLRWQYGGRLVAAPHDLSAFRIRNTRGLSRGCGDSTLVQGNGRWSEQRSFTDGAISAGHGGPNSRMRETCPIGSASRSQTTARARSHA